MKNICANFDHGTDPKSTVVAMTNNIKTAFVQELSFDCRNAQTNAMVALPSSERMNKSARMMRNGELPSAATSTRMKNQNQ